MGDSTYPSELGEAQAPAQPEIRSIDADSDRAAALLRTIFNRVEMPVQLRLWSGATLDLGAASNEPARFTLVFNHPRTVSALVLGRDPLQLVEAYFSGDLDIEGDLFAALALKDHLERMRLSWHERLGALLQALRLRADSGREASATAALAPSHGRQVKVHSRQENRDAIQFHYDVSNEFYRLWLDRSMVYSCGYFESADATLDEAQEAKLELICRKLLLRPGERFLDIGCGWGALLIHAARHHGVHAHGITLSEKQFKVASERIAEAGLGDRVTVELRDYRDLTEEAAYDKVASVGMFEHVGLKNLPLYFAVVHRVLKREGLFLNHGITHANAGWKKNLSTEFINRYVFPDGELDRISAIQSVMEQGQFEIADVESLRMHYARTLRAWVERLEGRRSRALEYINESTYRVWRLYMAACALEFEGGNLGIYQILAAKRGGNPSLPLTRRHLYGSETISRMTGSAARGE